jgi:threonine dehydrogenase-like Zn-dependent dehydrogenase
VIAGFHQDGPRTVDLQGWNWRGIDVVNAHERRSDAYVEGMREAVRLAAAGTLDIEALVTHVLPLDELERAFQLATARPAGFVKAVVCP